MDGLFTGLQNAGGSAPAPRQQVSRIDRVMAAQLLPSLDQKGLHAPHHTKVGPWHQPWLAAALHDLKESVDEAREEGYPEPTGNALAVAEALLRRVARVGAPLPRPNVYPTADHEIDLYFRRGDLGVSVLVVIDHDGGGACFSNVGGRHRARHENINRMIETIELELIGLSRIAVPD
jgi:hypothetical protein